MLLKINIRTKCTDKEAMDCFIAETKYYRFQVEVHDDHRDTGLHPRLQELSWQGMDIVLCREVHSPTNAYYLTMLVHALAGLLLGDPNIEILD